MNDDQSTKADDLLAEERAQRPHWRDSATKPAPAWFRGDELDMVDPEERRQLYLAARSRLGPYPWFMIIMTLAFIPGAYRGLGMVHRWIWIAVAVFWLASITFSTLMRRRTLRKFACQSLRESPDWPQRLDQRRTSPTSAK